MLGYLVENVFALWKRRVYRYALLRASKAELVTAADRAWDEIPTEHLVNSITSMARRMRDVEAAGGGYTRW